MEILQFGKSLRWLAPILSGNLKIFLPALDI